MTFTIDPKKCNIEVLTTSNSLTKEEINNLKEVSDKFPTYTILIRNQGGGNSGGGCGCGGKCSNSKLHTLLNKEIFNLKSRVLTLELNNSNIWKSYPTYPDVYYTNSINCNSSKETIQNNLGNIKFNTSTPTPSSGFTTTETILYTTVS